jgi:tRNA (guanine-N7-)-methyltransferase
MGARLGSDAPPGHRPLLPSTKRRGRLTPTRRRHLEDLGPRYGLGPSSEWTPGALDRAFGRAAPRLLEIGPGRGDATVDWAQATPTWDVLAVELHRPSIATLLAAIDLASLANVRVVEEDARGVMAVLEPGAFAAVRILFPDPWPKRRHHARRLVDADLVAAVAGLLPLGGTLHVATDWDDYADQVREVVAGEPRLRAIMDGGGDGTAPTPGEPGPEAHAAWHSTRPERPVTTYERRGLDAGRRVTDLVVERVEVPPEHALRA